MQGDVKNLPAHKRFGNLSEGDQLEQFEWFTLTAARYDDFEQGIVQCEAGWAEFWAIYGVQKSEAGKENSHFTLAVHDEPEVQEAVRIAAQIAAETGKGFMVGDEYYGLYPRSGTAANPTNNFQEIAEDLTTAIHDDLEDLPEGDRTDQDFDSHALAGLREAFVDYSDYSGSDKLDPYKKATTAH